ncbi:unnamed protein product [Aphis gossypii]|uniref:Uncharacterized protein n=1 Tax=Aphis gossypii TaxID=80765 RepID=A0A9P0JD66_APHGO|nr:unnamed protein product [Aphis gossypii]
MYSPLSELVQHWYIAHSTFRKRVFAQFFHITLNTHLHRVLAITGKLIEDIRQNGGCQTLMYACLFWRTCTRNPETSVFRAIFTKSRKTGFIVNVATLSFRARKSCMTYTGSQTSTFI